MKTLLLLAAVAAAVWFGLDRAKRAAAVQAAQNAPVAYAKSLSEDEARAKKAAEQANAAVQKTEAEVKKALDADR